MRMSAPSAFASSSVPSPPGTRIMSPKQVKIDVRLHRHRDPVVDPAHRDDADRTARAVDELDVLRQEIVDAVLVDRVRVAAADLHHLVVAAGLDDAHDLAGEDPAELRVAELVDELHAAAPSSRAIAVPACTSSSSPRATGTDEVDHDRRAGSVLSRAEREPVSGRLDHPHRHALVRARDAVPVGAGVGHSITLAFKLLELLLVRLAHVAQQAQRRVRLFLVDLREGEPDVDQHPVAGLRAVSVPVEQADVDVALDAGDIDPGEAVLLVDDLHDLPRNREAHAVCALLLAG